MRLLLAASSAAIAVPLAVGTWLVSSSAVSAQTFAAKSVNIVVGFPPGGGYDTMARVFARHYGKHLPGNPNLVVQIHFQRFDAKAARQGNKAQIEFPTS